MAVPGAVTRRAEREANELREQGIDPLSGAPIAAQVGDPSAPTIPATPAPAPAPTEDTAALKARIAELEQEARTQSGRASTSATELENSKRQLETVNGNRTFLESKLTELVEETDKLRAENASIKAQTNASQVDKAVASLDGAGPTEEQLKEFGPEGVDFVTRVVSQRMVGVIKPLVERLQSIEKSLGRLSELDKLPKLEELTNVASMETARQKELEFMRKEIIAYYPDFDTVKSTTEWKDYLAEDIPGRGIKVGHLLHSYRQTSNALGLRAIIAGFYDRKKPSGLDSLVVPDKTNADVPLAPAPVKIKASEYKQKLRDFISKKLPKAEWEAFRAKFDEATRTGNVEMDAEIR